MAIFYPDNLQHNNSNKFLVDITEIKGTSYPIGVLSETGSIPTDKRNIGQIVFVSSSQQYFGYYGATTQSADWDNTSNWRTLSTFSGSYTGSFSGSFTGSLLGTASYATQALSSSFALSASWAPGGTGVGFPFTGSAVITGSLTVTGSVRSTLGFTGSLLGTASFATTASYASNNVIASAGSTLYSILPLSTNSPNINASIFLGGAAGNGANASFSNFLGGRAGYGATNASFSNFLGYQAGEDATSASYSNFLGFNVGKATLFREEDPTIYESISSITSFSYDEHSGAIISATVDSIVVSGDYSALTQPFTSTYFGITGPSYTINLDLTYYSAPVIDSITYDSIADETTFNFVPSLNPQYHQINDTYPGVGSNNIIIGTNITLENNRQDSINIGGIIFGTGSHSDTVSSNPFSGSMGGSIGINMVNPVYTLDVSGSGRFINNLIITDYTIGKNVINNNIIQGSFDLAFPSNSALRFGSPNFDGATFQGFGANNSQFPGQIYFDYGSLVQNVPAASLNIRSLSPTQTSTVLFSNMSGSVGLSTTNPLARLHIRGSGTTSATTTLRVENSSSIASLIILDNNSGSYNGNFVVTGSLVATAGFTGNLSGTSSWANNAITASFVQNAISASFASTASFVLNTISSSFSSTASFVNPLNQAVTITGSLTVVSGSARELQVTPTGVNIGSIITDAHTITGSLGISGSSNFRGNVTITGSTFISSSNATQLQVGSNLLFVSGSGNVGIGTTTPNTRLDVNGNVIITGSATNSLLVRGNGATSATAALRVENSNAVASLIVLNNQTVGIGRIPTSSLDVAGTTRLSGSFNTAASGSILTVIGSGSAQPIFTVQGSQGELFSVTDSLSGSLFSINDISGLPIMEVFSDNTILMGDYQDPMLLTTRKTTQTDSGSFIVYSIPTASYDGAFFEYSLKSGSNARAGTIMSTWAGSSIVFTETTTLDVGNTTAVGLTMILSGSNAVLTGSSATGSWTIRTIIRTI